MDRGNGNDKYDKEKIDRWNKIHIGIGSREEVRKQYDGWLELNNRIQKIVQGCKTPIIDLGCGSGNNTLHLTENGKQVIACDFSPIALEKIRTNIPEATTREFNMEQGLPFSKDSTELVVADLSLHYFSNEKTSFILDEIRRMLAPGGHLVFRVNSVNDKNFGAGQGIEIEPNFYEVRETTKRFFDEPSLRHFLPEDKWDFIHLKEEEMPEENIRTLWQDGKTVGSAKRKTLWTCAVRKK